MIIDNECYVLMWCTNDSFDWTEFHKVSSVKGSKFSIDKNKKEFYSVDSIIDIIDPKEISSYVCVNCKCPIKSHKFLLCNDTYCTHEFKRNMTHIGGFQNSKTHHVRFKDLRISNIGSRHLLRENLWSRDEIPEENTYAKYDTMLFSIRDNCFLHKSKFADRRLSHKNKGKRYNLHPH